MLTRCPHCATAFRARPEQVRARGGKVRCGQCGSVFDAVEEAIERPLARVEPGDAAGQPAQPETAATQGGASGDALEDTFADLDAAPAELPAPEASPANELESFESIEALEALESIEIIEDVAPAKAEKTDEVPAAAPIQPPDASALEDIFSSMPAPEAAPRSEPEPPLQAAPAVPETPAEPSPAASIEANAGAMPGEPRTAAESAEAQAGEDSAAAPRIPRTPPRWLAPLAWSLGILLLCAGFVGQGAYFFRNELFAAAPALRPALAQMCAAAGCTTALPRQASKLSIADSELQADPARPGLLVLNATLRNASALAQQYPALELTLTDAQDEAVARRVIAPADYLTEQPGPDAGLAPRSTLAVRLWIEARDLPAAGYRLYLFYP